MACAIASIRNAARVPDAGSIGCAASSPIRWAPPWAATARPPRPCTRMRAVNCRI